MILAPVLFFIDYCTNSFSTKTSPTGFGHGARSFQSSLKVSVMFVVREIRRSLAARCFLQVILCAKGAMGLCLCCLPSCLLCYPHVSAPTVLWCKCHRVSVAPSSPTAREAHEKETGERVVEQPSSGLLCFLSLLFLSLSLSFSFFLLFTCSSLFLSCSSPNFNTPVSSSMAPWPMCACLHDCLVQDVFVLMSRHTFSHWFGFHAS